MRMVLLCVFCVYALEMSALKSIQDLQWKNRVLVYFPEKGKTIDATGLEKEMQELKLVWFEKGDALKTNYPHSIHSDFANSLNPEFFDVQLGNWILVGLDGGVKLSGKGKPDWKLIFSTIETMPMRKAEIKTKTHR